MKQQTQGYEIAGAPLQLTAEVSAIEGDRELSNNTAPLRFRAVTQKRKILILDGRPRWETRYLVYASDAALPATLYAVVRAHLPRVHSVLARLPVAGGVLRLGNGRASRERAA